MLWHSIWLISVNIYGIPLRGVSLLEEKVKAVDMRISILRPLSVKEKLIQNNTIWRVSNRSIKTRQYYEVIGYEWPGCHDV